ncbi:hypothetical protein FS837_003515, partial [Tulasnella sp. UAMH 9824]
MIPNVPPQPPQATTHSNSVSRANESSQSQSGESLIESFEEPAPEDEVDWIENHLIKCNVSVAAQTSKVDHTTNARIALVTICFAKLAWNNKGTGSQADQPFTDDWGFWAAQSEFDAYLAAVKGAKVNETEIPKCHNFKAGDPSRSGGGTGTVVGGSVIIYGRAKSSWKWIQLSPQLFEPNTQGNDRSTVTTLHANMAHFQKRITTEFDSRPLIKPDQYPKDIQFLVPAWHILGHVDECLARYHFHYTPLVGRTAGEAQRLFIAYFDATKEYQQKKVELQEIEEDLPPDYLVKLKNESAACGPEQFLSATIQVPTKTQILVGIRNVEDAKAQITPSSSSHSEAMFINNAIDLTDLQYQLRVKKVEVGPNPGGDRERRAFLLMEERVKNQIGEHFSTLLRVCPELQEADLVQGQPLTTQKLYLLSDFIDTDWPKYKLEKIAQKEAQMQVAEAHDALRQLRNALGLKALLLQNQKKHVRGYDQNTKARGSIVIPEKGIKRQAEAYKRAWMAICNLGVTVAPNTAAGDLQPLLDGDIVPLREFSDEQRFIGDNDGIPWIWRFISVNGTDGEVENGVIGTVNSWNNE